MAKKILLVDDEVDFLTIMGERIEAWGYDVITAKNALEALELFDKEKPDVIAIDYLMPEVNGIELLRKIREISKDIPAIILTAKPESEVIGDATKLNISAFIPKLSPYADVKSSLQTTLGMIFKGR